MNKKSIFLLVATTDRKILQNTYFQNLKTNENLQLIISNQKIFDKTDLVYEKAFTQIFNQDSKGISINRNNCLSIVNEGIGVITDDDVSYVDGFENTILDAFEINPEFDIFTFKIKTEEGKSYKNYPKKSFEIRENSLNNRRRISQISSIEIAFDIKKLKQNKISFDTEFGIGSEKYVGGEEVVFLLDALKSGLKIKYIPTFIVNHPFESSGKIYSEKLLLTFGQVFRRIFGIWYYPFSIYFLLKKRKQLNNAGIPFSKAMKCILNK